MQSYRYTHFLLAGRHVWYARCTSALERAGKVNALMEKLRRDAGKGGIALLHVTDTGYFYENTPICLRMALRAHLRRLVTASGFHDGLI
jgi:hypothetical protein